MEFLHNEHIKVKSLQDTEVSTWQWHFLEGCEANSQILHSTTSYNKFSF